MNFLGKKYINIEIMSYSMDQKNWNNFYKIFIYTLEFFPDFSSQKNNFLNISGNNLPFWALSRHVGIFSVFFRIFLAFFRIF
jgi:hypothetical protein